MPLFPRPADRIYVECPRCHSSGAFVTYERVRTRCAFCPDCQNLWDTVRPEYAEDALAVVRVGQPHVVT
jgi:hypothetical protein